MKIAAQAESATVDWIPIVGPALGKIASFGTEMASKAVQAVENVAIQTAEQIRTASTAMASVATFDSKALVSQFGDLAEKRIPIFGVVVHAATDSVMQLAGATETAAQRLATYSGALAGQQAEQEVALIMREIQRASRFEQNVGAANEAQFAMNMKLGELTDRFVPFVMAIAEKLFNVAEKLLEVVDDGVKEGLQTLDGIVQFLDWLRALPLLSSIPGSDNIHNLLLNIHNLIQTALADAAPDPLGATWDAFATLGSSFTSAAPVMAPTPGATILAPGGV